MNLQREMWRHSGGMSNRHRAGSCSPQPQPHRGRYFVHSYRAMCTAENASWVLTETDYGDASQTFVSSVHRGNVMATQFHPEKSGRVGLRMLANFLNASTFVAPPPATTAVAEPPRTVLARRVIACLDVRTNDRGDLVVTKGARAAVPPQLVILTAMSLCNACSCHEIEGRKTDRARRPVRRAREGRRGRGGRRAQPRQAS